jgi:RNA polymerase sigma-70 factor (ECF subfamily)
MQISRVLIRSCIQKEERACRSLYEASAPYVLAIVRRYIYNTEIHRDLVQEIFATIFRKLHLYDENKGVLKYWIRKVTINHCLLVLKEQKKQAPVVPINVAEHNFPDQQKDMHDLTRNDLLEILSAMPVGYKTVFMLLVIDGYSHEEISEQLGISRETSRSQLSRAKAWIRKNFDNHQIVKADGFF